MSYPRPFAHGLMFHHFHGGRHPVGQGSISSSDLEAIIRHVDADRILRPEEWLRRLDADSLEPGDLCLTFDDALLSQVELALPVLERHGLGAFWFVYSSVFDGRLERFEIYRAFRTRCFARIEDFYQLFFERIGRSEFAGRASAAVEDGEVTSWLERFPFYSTDDVRFRLVRNRALTVDEYEQVMDAMIADHGLAFADLARDLWMTDDHLRYLTGRGDVIGLHSYSHPMSLADLSGDEQEEQYRRNAAHIARVCGVEPRTMAHPAGSYDKRTLDLLARMGIRCGFRSSMDATAVERPGAHLELPREDHTNVMRAVHEENDEDQ
jgi:peptidoglycan/xylan/chitin deacetylase (PgdA/CDA1 family)